MVGSGFLLDIGGFLLVSWVSGFEWQDDGVAGDIVGSGQGVAGDGDFEGDLAGVHVVVDFESECFEQPACQVFWESFHLDGPHWQGIDQISVGGPDFAFLGIGEGVFESLFLCAQFSTAFVDVADKVPVEFIDEFHAANVFLDLAIDVGDRTLECGDFLFPFLSGVLAGGGSMLLEKVAAVAAEDVAVEEVVELCEQSLFPHEVAARTRVSGGDVVLLGPAHVVRDLAAGLAEHAALAQLAEQERAEDVGPFGLGVFGVGSRAAARAEAMVGDGLDLDEGFQVHEGFMDGSG
ncbi:hypothetical protein ACFYXQ_03515 [Nocardia jiangxiensis]|uniref:Uncharacterized protein n=1 Tax=Nocardia jiangxiensis TaxID=282685 RepID=A0ABW6RS57_9NOCA